MTTAHFDKVQGLDLPHSEAQTVVWLSLKTHNRDPARQGDAYHSPFLAHVGSRTALPGDSNSGSTQPQNHPQSPLTERDTCHSAFWQSERAIYTPTRNLNGGLAQSQSPPQCPTQAGRQTSNVHSHQV